MFFHYCRSQNLDEGCCLRKSCIKCRRGQAQFHSIVPLHYKRRKAPRSFGGWKHFLPESEPPNLRNTERWLKNGKWKNLLFDFGSVIGARRKIMNQTVPMTCWKKLEHPCSRRESRYRQSPTIFLWRFQAGYLEGPVSTVLALIMFLYKALFCHQRKLIFFSFL